MITKRVAISFQFVLFELFNSFKQKLKEKED